MGQLSCPLMDATLRSVLLLTMVLTLPSMSGCRTDFGWKTVETDTPWLAPGIQAIQRQHSYAWYMAAGTTTDTYWGSGSRRGVNCDEIRRKFEAYIKRSGWLAQWSVTGSGINDIRQRLAPYRFTVVAVKPAIVIATPMDISGIANQYWDAHRLIDRPATQQIHTDYIITPLEFGTTVPNATQFTVVNLESGTRRVITATADTNELSYVTPGCRLFMVRTNGVWSVSRPSSRK